MFAVSVLTFLSCYGQVYEKGRLFDYIAGMHFFPAVMNIYNPDLGVVILHMREKERPAWL